MGIYCKATAPEVQAKTCFKRQDSAAMQTEIKCESGIIFKTTKDKLLTTEYGKGRDVEGDNEAEGDLELSG